jgi:hypothetical protein
MKNMGADVPTKYIIEGIDRLGKDTLIQNIIKETTYHAVLHFGKPILTKDNEDDDYPLQKYQRKSFDAGFYILRTPTNLIFNRFILGEVVYSPKYRNYSGDYIFELEKKYGASQMDNVKLILLTTSDFSFIKDDGLSFDFSKKEEEQADFIKAFGRSTFKHKCLIDVANQQGGFRSERDILQEALF